MSYVPLRTLIESGRTVAAVGCQLEPAPYNAKIPVFAEHSDSITSLALLHDIPLVELTGDWSLAVERLARISPDVILVSCFGRKLPRDIVSIPRHGCFNLHPSPLPRFRGPAPVFWQFRAGVESFGISVHYASAEIDAGDIVAQTRVTMPDGVNGRQADGLLAEAGSALIGSTLCSIENGLLKRRAQSQIDASYQGFPSSDDYAVSTRWTAKRMYNFICATRASGIIFPCAVDDRAYRLIGAKYYCNEGVDRAAADDNAISIKCSGGSVEAICMAGDK